MFRRRFFRRAIFRPPARFYIGERPRRALNHAHRLMDSGDYLEAAEIFERLADGALRRGIIQRAPHLYVQAARARTRAGQLEIGERLFKRGLKLLSQSSNWPAVYRTGNLAVNELEELGYLDNARQMKVWLGNMLENHSDAETKSLDAIPKTLPRLPEKCPYCGATVKSGEVEWLDQLTAECVYCGSAIREMAA